MTINGEIDAGLYLLHKDAGLYLLHKKKFNGRVIEA